MELQVPQTQAVVVVALAHQVKTMAVKVAQESLL
jgi:hypothetical protein